MRAAALTRRAPRGDLPELLVRATADKTLWRGKKKAATAVLGKSAKALFALRRRARPRQPRRGPSAHASRAGVPEGRWGRGRDARPGHLEDADRLGAGAGRAGRTLEAAGERRAGAPGRDDGADQTAERKGRVRARGCRGVHGRPVPAGRRHRHGEGDVHRHAHGRRPLLQVGRERRDGQGRRSRDSRQEGGAARLHAHRQLLHGGWRLDGRGAHEQGRGEARQDPAPRGRRKRRPDRKPRRRHHRQGRGRDVQSDRTREGKGRPVAQGGAEGLAGQGRVQEGDRRHRDAEARRGARDRGEHQEHPRRDRRRGSPAHRPERPTGRRPRRR